MNKICALLAKCFKAHQDEEEKEFRELIQQARQAAEEFNRSMDRLNRFGDAYSVYVLYTRGLWKYPERDSSDNFRLREINGALNRRTDV